MTTDRLRKLLALVLTAVPLAAAAVALALADLPDPVPTHWNMSGAVDGTTGRGPFTVISLAVCAAASLAAVAFARTERPRYGVAAAAFTAYLGGSVVVLTAALASGVAAAPDVELPWAGVAAVIAAALLGSALTWALWPDHGTSGPAEGPAADVPYLELGDNERVVYLAEIRSRGFAWLAAGSALLGLGIVATADVLVGVAVLAAAVAGALLQRASVRIDRTGLAVTFGPGVRVRVPLADIRQATPEQLRPMEWGGWGYRVLPSRRAVILRSGPGLVLDLTNGTRFAVTLDNPDEAAAVLNGLLYRSRQS